MQLSSEGRNLEYIAAEHDPHEEQGQKDVEGLADPVEVERLSLLEILTELSEVAVQSDAHKSECEELLPEDLGNLQYAVHTLVPNRRNENE